MVTNNDMFRIMKWCISIGLTTAIMLFILQSQAQEVYDRSTLMSMSLDQLLNVSIVTATKKEEDNFVSPLSATVITQQEIVNSGANSIVEVLRLAPGVIVREKSNGNYDVHLRGMDYVPPMTEFTNAADNATLAMIDNRIVYSDFQGGTFWETLPIEIHDIEQIEIVRGASSALYGPNAVNGVINIITKKKSSAGLKANANIQRSLDQSTIAQAAAQYSFSDFTTGVSVNHAHRFRSTDDYWDFVRLDAVPIDSVRSAARRTYAYDSTQVRRRYPYPSRSLKKTGLNWHTNYRPDEAVEFDLAIGGQQSSVQKIYVNNGVTPFTSEEGSSLHGNFRSKTYGLDFQLSYQVGNNQTLGVSGWEYDYEVLNGSLEYLWTSPEDKLNVRPGFLYRHVTYDDEASLESYQFGFIGGERHIHNSGFFLHTDYRPTDRWRFIGALRSEKNNHPGKILYSYQAAVNHITSDKQIIRAVAARSYKGPDVINTYMDFSYFGLYNFIGNKEMDLLKVDLFEVGFRRRLNTSLEIDVEAFCNITQDFNAIAIRQVTPLEQTPEQTDSVYFSQVTNIDLRAIQHGLTIEATYVNTLGLELRPFITVQQTRLHDMDRFVTDTRKENLRTMAHKWTPSMYGGAYINYITMKGKLNLNLSPYWMTKQTFNYQNNAKDTIDSWLIVNASAGYLLTEQLRLTLTAQNIGANGHNHFAFSDPVQARYFLGIRMTL